MRFATLNSIYEADLAAGQVRRIDGIFPPTWSRTARDGEWQDCLWVSPIRVGEPVVVYWDWAVTHAGLDRWECSYLTKVIEVTP